MYRYAGKPGLCLHTGVAGIFLMELGKRKGPDFSETNLKHQSQIVVMIIIKLIIYTYFKQQNNAAAEYNSAIWQLLLMFSSLNTLEMTTAFPTNAEDFHNSYCISAWETKPKTNHLIQKLEQTTHLVTFDCKSQTMNCICSEDNVPFGE